MKREILCPAKINTFLAVGPKDRIGYHPLRTFFQAVDLYDRLAIEPSDRDEIVCSWVEMPAENTLTKVLRLIRELVVVPPLKVELEKNIPAESGLGGGSSDAAGLLRLVQQVIVKPLPDHVLKDIAVATGADVPFFLEGGMARAEGYGEELVPWPDSPIKPLVIVRPDVGVSTPQAFAALDQTPYEWREFPQDPWDLYNDFERVAPCACLHLKESFLSLGAAGALLCGSGSAVFGVFDSPEVADGAFATLQGQGIRSWRANTVPRNP